MICFFSPSSFSKFRIQTWDKIPQWNCTLFGETGLFCKCHLLWDGLCKRCSTVLPQCCHCCSISKLMAMFLLMGNDESTMCIFSPQPSMAVKMKFFSHSKNMEGSVTAKHPGMNNLFGFNVQVWIIYSALMSRHSMFSLWLMERSSAE